MVRGKEILEAIRSRIVALDADGVPQRQIAKILNVSRGGVQQTLRWFNNIGSVALKKRLGRPSKLSNRDLSSLTVASKRNRRSCSRELTAEMVQNCSMSVSAQTVRRVLNKYGLRGCVAIKKPFINQKTKLLRVQFAKAHKTWSEDKWMTVLWTDEKKLNLHGKDGRDSYWLMNFSTFYDFSTFFQFSVILA